MKNGKKKGSFNKVTKNPLLKRKAKKKKRVKINKNIREKRWQTMVRKLIHLITKVLVPTPI